MYTSDDIWYPVYSTTANGGHTQSSWTTTTLDVSAQADGNPNFQVRFTQDFWLGIYHDAGWNVDQLTLESPVTIISV